jgi:hypothetical protein
MLQIIDGEIEPTRRSVCYLCYDMVGHQCEGKRGEEKSCCSLKLRECDGNDNLIEHHGDQPVVPA